MKRILTFFTALLMLLTGCSNPKNNTATLTFHSFDGGGPEYSTLIEDTTVVSCSSERKYNKSNHEELDGAGYNAVFTFTGLKPGETKVTVQERSPIGDNRDIVYNVKVADDLSVTITELTTEDLNAATESVPTLVINIGDKVFYATLEDNPSAQEFAEKLSEAEITIDMHDYGNFEKVGDLPWTLPTNDESITAVPGDIILYQGDKLTIYYDENKWDLTRLARIENVTKEELLDALGDGDVTVRLCVEWSE